MDGMKKGENMILRVPDYYDKFSCIGSECSDTCCAGWEIDIDEETFDYYLTLPGPFGERLRANMAKNDETSFVLKKGRCPFLNEDNLCDIYIELGEEALCDICTMYPRYRMEYADTREICLGAACVECGRLIFDRKDKITFVERELAAGYDMGEDLIEAEEEGGVSRELAIRCARDFCIELVQDRQHSIYARAERVLDYGQRVQKRLNEKHFSEIIELTKKERTKEAWANFEKNQSDSKMRYDAFLDRMELFGQMEVLDMEWQSVYQRLGQVSEPEYDKWLPDFVEFYQDREYEYEHLLVYFIFQYAMKAIYDNNFLGKIQFSVISFLMIRDMDLVRFHDQDRQFSVADRIDVVRIFSKEVEHSPDNLDYLAEELLFSDFMYFCTIANGAGPTSNTD